MFRGEHRIGAGWSSPVARQAHNLKVAGSNPAPATNVNCIPVPLTNTGAYVGREGSIDRLCEDIRSALRAGALESAWCKFNTIPQHCRGALLVRLLESELLEGRGDLEGALAKSREARREFPENFWTGVRLVRVNLKLGRSEEACDIFETDVWPSEAPIEIKERLFLELAESDSQLSARLLSSRPRDPIVLMRRAAELARKGNLQEALDQLEATKALSPLTTSARKLQAFLLTRMERYRDALAIIRDLVSDNPNRLDCVRQEIFLLHCIGGHG